MYNPQLETFLYAADAGSFSKAAEQMFITPTAVIKQINLLESTLDIKLFDRTHRGLTLTKAGVSFYKDAKYIIQYSKDSVSRAKNAMKGDDNVIRIGTSPMTPAQALIELWPTVHEQCPEIKFQMIPFENSLENASEILANLGRDIDIVVGLFDEVMLRLRQCAGFELSREPLCCAVSIYHPLASKTRLSIEDLHGENLLIMHRDWSCYVDELRDFLWKNHPQIQLVDFDLYRIEVFNRCENGNDVLLCIEPWANIHPLLKVIPVEWDYTMPYGLLHSPAPSATVEKFLAAVQTIKHP
ncbi:MAG: LysR family transcriptional regulator [Lachnospiraceae bacterium]|jgi:DNA-binding transcriptional LysR family regulator|nr:LysR family transcriptional regulator [Lachnospiraceae bacterium]